MKEVPVFIASSINEFKRERVELRAYLLQLNQLYKPKGVRLEWYGPEDSSYAMRSDGSQGAFDDEIRNSDFCFFIVGQNAGKYTRHEFEIAWEHFREYKKPQIFCYFVQSAGEFPSDSAVEFRKYLKNMGYYYKDCLSWSELKLEIQIELTRGGAFDVQEEINKDEESYIFISYSHQNVEIVNPILETMIQEGYNIWYDKMIPLAMTWKDEIAEHIEKCAIFIAFHSAASSNSEHCQAEVNFAISNKKRILSVYLEDNVQLSSGLKMYLSRDQSVKFSQYKNSDDFVEKLNQDNSFTICKKTSPYNKSVRRKLEINVKRAIICNNRGNQLRNENHLEEAEGYYREALEIYLFLSNRSPDNYQTDITRTCLNLGNLLESMNRLEEAEPYYQEARYIANKSSQKNNPVL